MSSLKPPVIACIILRAITRPGNRSLILGDLEEDYRYHAEENGKFYAKFWYWMQLFIPLQSFIKDLFFWSYFMFKNYFKSAYRNLFRNKLYGAISIVSLAITIGCAVSLFSILHLFFKFDSNHKNSDLIFMIAGAIAVNDSEEIWADTPLPLGSEIRRELPMIKNAVRVTRVSGKVKYGEGIFYESITFADQSFLDMFTYPLIDGKESVLSERDAVIITEEIALKYFGDEKPVGKQLVVTMGNGNKVSYIVKAIAENISIISTFGFDILMNFENLYRTGILEKDDWSTNIRATFFIPENLGDIPLIESQLNKYIDIQNRVNPDRKIMRFTAEPLLSLYENPNEIRNSITGSGNPKGPVVFTIIGILLLVLACINYMNVAISTASKRLKEIGLRKVFGSKKSGVVVQFLTENLLTCLSALILGTILAQTLFFPALRKFGELNIQNNIFTSIDVWYIFPVILLFTSLMSGLYPSVFISRYNPITIFKGKRVKTGKNRIIKTLLGFQFVITFILITLTIVVRHNAEYQSTLDWGYDPSNVIIVPVSPGQYPILENEVRQNPDVLEIAGSIDHLGKASSSATIEFQGTKYRFMKFDVGINYIQTLDLNVIEGRNFNIEKSTDRTSSVLVNEEMVRQMDWNEPVGKHFNLGTIDYTVIGVVEDFHHYNFMAKIRPMFFRISDEDEHEYLLIRTKNEMSSDTFEYLREKWKKLIPEEPFNAFYQAFVLDDYLRSERNIGSLFGVYALVALVISSLGIFGLVSLNVMRRIKEIGIRKVLGAGTFSVIRLVNKEYTDIMLTSTIPASILSYFSVNALIAMMHEYHLSVSVFHIIFTFIIIIFTTLLTIFSLVNKAAKTNPADTLRYE